MEVPEIRYAKSDDLNIAYQRYGSGPDVVVIPPLVSNIEMMWESELWHRMLEFVGRHVRVLQFDKRGIGMSDRFERHPTLEQCIGDIEAVMDAEALTRASILGTSEGGLMAQLFAALHPERVERLVLVNSLPGGVAWSRLAASSARPVPQPGEMREKLARLVETWGRDPSYFVDWFMPSQRDNASFVRWMGRYQRQSASPADVRRQLESIFALDASEHLRSVRAPTRVIHVVGDRVVPVAAARLLASCIPGADLVEVEGEDHFCWVTPGWRSLVDRWLEFILGAAPAAHGKRRFAAVLFTDIVDSTARSRALGDDAWQSVLESHDRVARRLLAAHRGTLVKSTGDGLLVTFPSPSEAVACASALRNELAGIGVEIRGGLHAGEVVVHDDGDVSGVAVNLAARVADASQPGAIYVSSTVRDLLLGGTESFVDRGEHRLKGIEDAWRLYELAR